ncbi:MAG: hypothetical protein ABH826_04790 [Patescibacteria group bacterium]
MLELANVINERATARFDTLADVVAKKKANLASRRMHEYLLALEMRFRELDIADYQLTNPEHVGATKSLNDLQFGFVDKTEAFHEQVYATLGASAAFLSYFLKHGDRRGLRLGSSIKKMLKDLKALLDGSGFEKTLDVLEKSREFRDKVVIHPQTHAQHDWMTQGGQNVSAVIYYAIDYSKTDPKEDGLPVHAPPQTTLPFSSPEEYRDYLRKMFPWMQDIYVPPSHEEVFSALKALVRYVLENY